MLKRISKQRFNIAFFSQRLAFGLPASASETTLQMGRSSTDRTARMTRSFSASVILV